MSSVRSVHRARRLPCCASGAILRLRDQRASAEYHAKHIIDGIPGRVSPHSRLASSIYQPNAELFAPTVCPAEMLVCATYWPRAIASPKDLERVIGENVESTSSADRASTTLDCCRRPQTQGRVAHTQKRDHCRVLPDRAHS